MRLDTRQIRRTVTGMTQTETRVTPWNAAYNAARDATAPKARHMTNAALADRIVRIPTRASALGAGASLTGAGLTGALSALVDERDRRASA